MSWSGRANRVACTETRANARKLKWGGGGGSVDHGTMMAVISASGQHSTSLFVLPGVHTNYRRRRRDVLHIPSDYLPSTSYLMIRELVRISLLPGRKNFVTETQYMRQNGRYILLMYEGFAGHLSYEPINSFK